MRSVQVGGKPADWTRTDDHELVITPQQEAARRARTSSPSCATTASRGPSSIPGFDPSLEAGFIHTDDGAVVAGQPEVAANWYPVNDHPLDKATYTFTVTVPAGLEVIANGDLVSHTHARARHHLDLERDRNRWRPTWRPPASGSTTWRPTTCRAACTMYEAVDPDLYTESTDADDPGLADVRRGRRRARSRTHGAILDFLGGHVRPVPVHHRRRQRRRLRRPVLRAGEPDADRSTRSTSSSTPFGGDSVVVHENAHQWFGDSVAVRAVEGHLAERGLRDVRRVALGERTQGLFTEQEAFDFYYNVAFPADDPFWTVVDRQTPGSSTSSTTRSTTAAP